MTEAFTHHTGSGTAHYALLSGAPVNVLSGINSERIAGNSRIISVFPNYDSVGEIYVFYKL